MFFWKNFPDGSMNFLNISHGENTEAQKGHRAAPDFSILAAWRYQGKVASKIESYQKMKWYRENQEAAGNQATAEKPGGFGKAKGGGGGTLPGPPRLYRKRDALFQGALPPKGFATKGLRRQGAVPPRGCAAKGLRLQGAALPRGCAAERLCRRRAVPPRGYATKGLCRQGLLSPKRSAAKGGNQARYLLPRTRTAPARAATVMRLSHRPMAASSAVLGLSVPLLPVLPPLLALGSAAPQTVHLPSL